MTACEACGVENPEPATFCLECGAQLAATAFEVDSPWVQADTLMDVAEVLELGGRDDEAREAVERALQLYSRRSTSSASSGPEPPSPPALRDDRRDGSTFERQIRGRCCRHEPG